jgi:hypothetical protein
MKQLIACCGIDCETCDARIATVNNDNALREKTAKKWAVMYNVPNIPPDTINCTGCRIGGAKVAHCGECEIRICVKAKGLNTCGDCEEMDTCPTVGFILQHVPGTRENLIS